MDPDATAKAISILGKPAAWEFLRVLERPDDERAALIGRLHAGDDRRRRVAELLTDLEDEVGRSCGCGWSTRSGGAWGA